MGAVEFTLIIVRFDYWVKDFSLEDEFQNLRNSLFRKF